MQYNMESKIGKQNKRCKKEGVKKVSEFSIYHPPSPHSNTPPAKKNFFLFFISTLTPLFENK